MRFHLIATTMDDISLEVELTASDAGDAVNKLSELLRMGDTPEGVTGFLMRVYSRPVEGTPEA